MNVDEEKNRLRKAAKAVRASIEKKEETSEKIAQKLFSLEEYKNCTGLFAYFSYPGEVSTKHIIEKALSDGKKVALPRCETESEMNFYYAENISSLESGKFKGILEPGKTAEKASANEKTLILVPALAFGKNGSRLGHGKGYYDRFLSKSEGKTAGLCFEKLLFPSLPEDGFDRRVSLIVTENEIIRTEKTVPQK